MSCSSAKNRCKIKWGVVTGETVRVRRGNERGVGVVRHIVFEFKYFDDFKKLSSVLKS